MPDEPGRAGRRILRIGLLGVLETLLCDVSLDSPSSHWSNELENAPAVLEVHMRVSVGVQRDRVDGDVIRNPVVCSPQSRRPGKAEYLALSRCRNSAGTDGRQVNIINSILRGVW